MASKEASVWQSVGNKAMWLGAGIIGLVALNTFLKYQERNRKQQQDDEELEEQNFKATDALKAFPNLANGNARFNNLNDVTLADVPEVKKLLTRLVDSARAVNDAQENQAANRALLTDRKGVGQNVFSIVFTGGPCAGKTTAITQVAEILRERGYPVICVPEAASLVVSNGISMNIKKLKINKKIIEFQKNIFLLRTRLEDIFATILSIGNIKNEKKCIVLIERGIIDGKAFMDEDLWHIMLTELNLHEKDLYDSRYDMVIHMTTAADGAIKYFQYETNQPEGEQIKAAKAIDHKLQDAWKSHQGYFKIANDVESLNDKVNIATRYILDQLGAPSDFNFSEKFLMKDPTGEFFEEIVKKNSLNVTKISDYFMESGQTKTQSGEVWDYVEYSRSREDTLSRLTFIRGKRFYTNGENNYSTKRNINWKEHLSYVDVQKEPWRLERSRGVGIINNLYIMFDSISVQSTKFIIVTVQCSDRLCKMETQEKKSLIMKALPNYIREKIAKDITQDGYYRLENVAKSGWKLKSEDLEPIMKL